MGVSVPIIIPLSILTARLRDRQLRIRDTTLAFAKLVPYHLFVLNVSVRSDLASVFGVTNRLMSEGGDGNQ